MVGSSAAVVLCWRVLNSYYDVRVFLSRFWYVFAVCSGCVLASMLLNGPLLMVLWLCSPPFYIADDVGA
jgi:hypothetical protein